MPGGAPCVAMAGVVTGLGNNHVFGLTTLFAIPFTTGSRGVAAAPTTTGDLFPIISSTVFWSFTILSWS